MDAEPALTFDGSTLSLSGNYKDIVYDSGVFIETGNTSPGTLFINLTGLSSQKFILSGNVTGFELLNIEEGREITIRVSGHSGDYEFCTGHDIHFVGEAPASLPSGKIGMLSIKCFGSTTGDCVGAWAVQD